MMRKMARNKNINFLYSLTFLYLLVVLALFATLINFGYHYTFNRIVFILEYAFIFSIPILEFEIFMRIISSHDSILYFLSSGIVFELIMFAYLMITFPVGLFIIFIYILIPIILLAYILKRVFNSLIKTKRRVGKK